MIKRCCGAICFETFGGPHWGNVEMIDETPDGPIHACEAHENATMGRTYEVPEPGCETIRENDEVYHASKPWRDQWGEEHNVG